MKIGYARVSSNSQDLELQKQALLKAGCKKIFSESVSGKDNNRVELGVLRPTPPMFPVYKNQPSTLKIPLPISHLAYNNLFKFQMGYDEKYATPANPF